MEETREVKSVFTTLNDINVNNHTEEKNGLTYLSWAWAWAEIKKNYPLATYKIYENDQGWNYFTDGKTAWVKTGVTIEGIENIEYLPVMDYKNKSIPIENVTSFNVNTAIQRSLTKACARHGLGLYIYAGEDIPEVEVKLAPEQEVKEIEELLKKLDNPAYLKKIKDTYNVKEIKQLTDYQSKEVIKTLKEYEKRTEEALKNKEQWEVKVNE